MTVNYESKIVTDTEAHIVIVISDFGNVRLKMTYECYNAIERFTGELFSDRKWEHFFSISDLGVKKDTSMYVRGIKDKEKRYEDLRKLGQNFFEKIVP
jgi:hypothetical protein